MKTLLDYSNNPTQEGREVFEPVQQAAGPEPLHRDVSIEINLDDALARTLSSGEEDRFPMSQQYDQSNV
jgi:hypothetical protein